MKKIKMWYARWFHIISLGQCEKWNLTFVRNVHGDEVNHLSNSKYLCRSIWADEKNNTYRCRNMYLGCKNPWTDNSAGEVGI